jgi:hypothetical protein
MLVGGILGGMMGQRWHTKLERAALADAAERDAERSYRDERTVRDEPAVTRREAAPPRRQGRAAAGGAARAPGGDLAGRRVAGSSGRLRPRRSLLGRPRQL